MWRHRTNASSARIRSAGPLNFIVIFAVFCLGGTTAMADAPTSPTLTFEGALAITDQGKGVRRYVVITNTVGARILLLRAGKHTFDASGLTSAERMKAPSIQWSRWRNVLAPGQKAKIPVTIPRTPYGKHVVEMTVEYAVPSEAFGKAHIKTVVSDGEASPGRYRSSLARGQTQPLLVAMTSDTEAAGDIHTVTGKWTLEVSPPPGLPKSVSPQTLTAFRLECPHFGILVQARGMVQHVAGETVTNLGHGDIDAYVRLGAAIAEKGVVTIRSGSFTPGISKAFETRTEPNLPYATDRDPGHSMSGDWTVFEVTAETLPKLWSAMDAADALRIEQFHGLVILPNAFRDSPPPMKVP